MLRIFPKYLDFENILKKLKKNNNNKKKTKKYLNESWLKNRNNKSA